ncbi:methyl-accepting chemotaxis protein [Photobacterium sp. SDRW27]|uniref:MCP four helix bundle domain-containing protein n=1 Tax=Photobacterium obscurum TaxID=2829490 RepID=UPI002243DEB0|nr:methyl-accepting chemotaxis protein [Photobacterium obscurum]MCW8332100.1 methyl-accepting chemotaxis protein [Photobacterium obscurum]
MLIRNKLAGGVGFNILLLICLGVYFISQTEALSELTVKMYNHPLTVTRATISADAGIVRMHRGMKDVALAQDRQAMHTAVEKVAEHEAEVYKQLDIVSQWNLGRAQLSVEQAAKAISSLDAITRAIDTITEMNTQIASASEQQSQVATEINESIVCISEVNERTASGAEQSAQTSLQLNELSGQLKVLVGEFKV